MVWSSWVGRLILGRQWTHGIFLEGEVGRERGHCDYSRRELAGAGAGQGPVSLGQDQGSVCGRV